MSRRRIVALVLAGAGALVLALCAVVVLSAPDIELPWSVSGGGGGSSSSTNFGVGLTAGQPGTGKMESTNFGANLGFWYGVGGFVVCAPVTGIDNGPGIAGDDTTIPNAAVAADFCDDDDDNDGLADVDELSATACAPFDLSTTTHPNPARGDVTNDDDGDGDPAPLTGGDASDDGPSWDTDNDGYLDGYECGQGSDPRDRLSVPAALPDDGDDDDGDGLLNSWERGCWGTSVALVDSDGDGVGDCIEAADVDGDAIVDFVNDVIYYAKAAVVPPASFGKTMDFDINKDGFVDFVVDVIQEAKFAIIPGLCQ